MIFFLLLLFSALAVSAVAAWFSIVGLMAIFPAAAIPILAMGSALEIAKLVTASFLYRSWEKIRWLMKSYFIFAVIVLSLITSMGIFGFLSKAHIEHDIAAGGNNQLYIENLERQITNQQRLITDSETVIGQLDSTVETLIEYDRIRGRNGALAVRESQTEQRNQLNDTINSAIVEIETLSDKLLPLKQEKLALEVEVGPIKYISQLILGADDTDTLDRAVRIVIILLVLVFDPLAILLVVGANMVWMERRGEMISFTSLDDDVVNKNVMEDETLADDWDDKPLDAIFPYDQFLGGEDDPIDDGKQPDIPDHVVRVEPEDDTIEDWVKNKYGTSSGTDNLSDHEKQKLNWLIDKKGKNETTNKKETRQTDEIRKTNESNQDGVVGSHGEDRL